jgi:hypothetical protein
MPPFELSKWEHGHPDDDAGSPYAVKDDFSVRTELSRDARAVLARGGTKEEARDAALAEMKRFLKKAHDLGIQVFLDVALNHVGHNYELRDLFVGKDASGREVREVKKNDFGQVVLDPAQLAVIQQKIDDPAVPDYMEYLAPWMYGDRHGDPHGANFVDDKAPGGWFEWPDTAQLNHGRMRWSYSWWDTAVLPEHKAVQGWLERVLRFWAVDVGVDGFRLDHLTGLPQSLLEDSLNRVQADVDAHRPGTNLFLFGEDFHTADQTRHFLDAGQGGWFHNLLGAKTPRDFESILEDPWFHELLNLSSDDEQRALLSLGNDHRATARLTALLQLFGGPVSTVAGDAVGERAQLPFKQYRGVVALRAASVDGKQMAEVIGRAGRARSTEAALQDDNRAWLRPRDGDSDGELLALSRFPDDKKGKVCFVAANLSNARDRENVFRLDEETRARIDPTKRYVVKDLMADDPSASLWPTALKGQVLLDGGLFIKLAPYQVQVLALEEAP